MHIIYKIIQSEIYIITFHRHFYLGSILLILLMVVSICIEIRSLVITKSTIFYSRTSINRSSSIFDFYYLGYQLSNVALIRVQ